MSNMNTKEYKHSKGQYFTTDTTLQKCVVDFIKNNPKIILEPSMGRGDLVECVSNKMPNVEFDMCELDTNIIPLDSIDKDKIRYGDFLKLDLNKTYDTIIGNPPYCNYRTGNLYVDFIKKCFDLLNPNGELIFVVPTDLFKLTFASKLLHKMIENGTFTYVYHPNKENLFEGATVDVMVFRYCKNATLEKVTLWNGNQKYLYETSGVITFSDTKKNVTNPKLGDIFNICVGFTDGKVSVFKNEKLGNIDIMTYNGPKKYIRITEYPSGNKAIDDYLLLHKQELLNRKSSKFTEKNWFKWARGNFDSIDRLKGQKCIYVATLRRREGEGVAKAGEVNYFKGMLMMRPINSNMSVAYMNKIINYINSKDFQNNFRQSGRFKIRQNVLSNHILPNNLLP